MNHQAPPRAPHVDDVAANVLNGIANVALESCVPVLRRLLIADMTEQASEGDRAERRRCVPV
jgi:6,7-dimethyl-8-ribityllumazine synthase